MSLEEIRMKDDLKELAVEFLVNCEFDSKGRLCWIEPTAKSAGLLEDLKYLYFSDPKE